MKNQVDEMEKSVDKAEKDLQIGLAANVKKVFPSFLPRRQTQVSSLSKEISCRKMVGFGCSDIRIS